MAEQASADYRLPHTASPERYEILLEPDLASSSFSGEETVVITLHEAVDVLVLNSLELEVFDVRVSRAGVSRVEGRAELDEEHEQVRLLFPSLLEPGSWILQLGFRGSSMKSSRASIGAPMSTPRERSACSPRHSLSRPTRVAPFPVGTSRLSRLCSRLA